MRTRLAAPGGWWTLALALAGALVVAPATPRAARAQAEQAGAPDAKGGKKKKEKKAKDPADSSSSAKKVRASHFFESESMLPSIVLTSNFGRLRRDRGDNPPWRWGAISYPDAEGKTVTVPVRLRTRGIWRRKNCAMPPIGIDFQHEEAKGTIFQGQNRPKLVVHCRDDDQADQYLLKELLAYRVYNVLTPVSHRARLARVQYVDSASGKQVAQRNAIFLESVDEMVNRVHGTQLKQQGATADDIAQDEDALFSLFQYFIGNTDFSVAALHNVELVSRDTSVLAVAHDFDWSGLVNAYYATPDPRVGVKRVRDRVYRGFCIPEPSVAKAVVRFDQAKDSIYALLTDSIGRLMKADERNDSKDYFDDFYQTVNDSRRLKREILDRCLGR